MIDLRYHIYSLVAVFLALAVGMLIGQAFVPTSPVERQQSKIAHFNRIMESMEADFATLRSEVVKQEGQIRILESEIKRGDEYFHALVPEIIEARLQWKNVAIVQTGDYGEETTAIKTALEEAGARVTSITQIKKQNVISDPDLASEISSSCKLTSDDQPCRALIRAIAGGAVAGAYYDKLIKMRDMGVVGLSGDYSRHNSYVVILGGGKDKDTSLEIDSPLIEEIKAAGSTVVGCEPAGANTSYIPAYKKAGIASVDNVDRPFGQIALVCALGGEVASFGMKDTADRLMPQSLTRKSLQTSSGVQ